MIDLEKEFEETPYLLLCGDSLDKLKELPDNSFDAIICDLPYGTTSCSWDSIIPFEPLWEQYKRVLKENGCAVLFGSQPFTSALIMSNPSWFKYELIWDKNKCGSPGLAKYRPMKTHENICVFAKNKTVYNPQMVAGEPYKRNPPKSIRCNNHKYGFSNTKGIENHGVRYPKSIIPISRDFSAQQQVHPTQKPVPLLEWLVKTYTNENDVVLDNTMGSGSTGVACIKLNRKFVGIEINEDYVNIAKNRISSIGVLW